MDDLRNIKNDMSFENLANRNMTHIYVYLVDQIQRYIFVVDNFLIAPPIFEICTFKNKYRYGARTEESTLKARISKVGGAIEKLSTTKM